jgi:esterase
MAWQTDMILHATEMGQGESLALLHGLFGAARNFGVVQRQLAQRRRVIALDLRNHGASPHDGGMRYATMAADVLETLDRLSALPTTLLGHSMGGKVAMQAALTHPDLTARLIVADIAPVAYPPHHRVIAEAMAALPMSRGMSRGQADAALAASVPDTGIRAFLLQNLQLGETPRWRIGLSEIIAALPVIEAWDAPDDLRYAGPTVFIAGAASDYIQPQHRPAIRSLFPRARFVTLKNAGHWLHAENPKGFVGVVEAFLTATG